MKGLLKADVWKAQFDQNQGRCTWVAQLQHALLGHHEGLVQTLNPWYDVCRHHVRGGRPGARLQASQLVDEDSLLQEARGTEQRGRGGGA